MIGHPVNVARCLLSRLVVKHSIMPLTTEQLLKTIENKQSTAMFSARGSIGEEIFRNSSGQLGRFTKALDKYSPVYKSELPANWNGEHTVGCRGFMCTSALFIFIRL